LATLKEFEDALRQHGMTNALAILDALKKRDREKRSIAPARRVVGRKMTAELARSILDLHASTGMTQQEIAFKLGVNQGRVNEVIKRGKWLNADPAAPEALSRDKAMQRLDQRARARRVGGTGPGVAASKASGPAQGAAGPSVTAVPALTAPPAAHPKAARSAMPIDPSRLAAVAKAPRNASSPGPRRLSEAATPIVSAQLAFLDL
jgi:hypothetical protein